MYTTLKKLDIYWEKPFPLLKHWLQCRSKTTYCDFYTVLTTGSITMKSGTAIISVPMSKSQQVTWQTLQECSVLWCVPASWCYFRVTLMDQIDISSGASLDGLCACAHVCQSVSILCTVTATFCISCCWCQDCLLRCHKCNDTHVSQCSPACLLAVCAGTVGFPQGSPLLCESLKCNLCLFFLFHPLPSSSVTTNFNPVCGRLEVGWRWRLLASASRII